MTDLIDRYGPGFTDAEYAALEHAREVRELRERVAELEAELSEYQGDDARHCTDYNTAQKRIAELESEIASLEEDVEFLARSDADNHNRAAAVEAQLAEIADTLKDPEAVLSMMLKGTVANIGWRRQCHLTGEVLNGEDVQLAEIVRLREQLAKVRELVGKWRRQDADRISIETLDRCADELESLLYV